MTKRSSLSYTDAGNGPAVVFIHGFCESKELWADYTNDLTGNYRIICPDLPGHGASLLEVEDFTIEYLADEIKLLLDDLKVKEVVLIGHSLGGYVTLAFAERYPGMVKGFGLFNSTAFADTEEKKRNRDRTIEFINKHGMDSFADSFVSPLFFHLNRELLNKEIKFMQEICRKTNAAAVIATVKAMRDRRERLDILKASKVPVLFIIGKDDTAVTLDKSLEQCYLPHKHQVCILSESGHMGMFEKPEESKNSVRGFLEMIW